MVVRGNRGMERLNLNQVEGERPGCEGDRRINIKFVGERESSSPPSSARETLQIERFFFPPQFFFPNRWTEFTTK